jgi:hypothetical protein
LIKQITSLALVALLGGFPAFAQDHDQPRGTGRGCIHTEQPPNSPITKATIGGITTAFFTGATDEYAHGVLGDAIEAKTIVINVPGLTGFCDQITAPEHSVFEDISPRLADVTGDGLNEVIVVNSHAKFGARLAIYGYPSKGVGIELLAATPYIGRPNRWLAPIGIADFNVDGHIDIAYIDRPHLAKTLRVWTYKNGKLVETANIAGLSNHRIGDDFISGGVRSCNGTPEMITADARWKRIIATRFENGKLTKTDIGSFKGKRSFKRALTC